MDDQLLSALNNALGSRLNEFQQQLAGNSILKDYRLVCFMLKDETKGTNYILADTDYRKVETILRTELNDPNILMCRICKDDNGKDVCCQ